MSVYEDESISAKALMLARDDISKQAVNKTFRDDKQPHERASSIILKPELFTPRIKQPFG
jgi:hypothetical protein